MKIAYILPGFGEKSTDKRYHGVRKVLRMKGYRVKNPKVNWRRCSLKNYTRQLASELRREKAPVLLLGFSFGAVVALLLAKEQNVNFSLCCALSPVFGKDFEEFFKEIKNSMPSLTKKKFIRVIGKRNFEYCKTLNWKEIANQTRAKTYFLMGEKELRVMKKRAKMFAKELNSIYRVVPKAGHEIEHKNYVIAVKRALLSVK